MPSITETPPPEIQQDLARLRNTLDDRLPPRMIDRNLMIATWNIRAFGGLTEKWVAGDHDSPKRDLHSLLTIAEIISRFDVVAVQEVKDNLKALRHVLKALGSDWGFVLTDVTRGDPGNDERLAFLFDRRTVQMSGLAGELVLPEEELAGVGPDALTKQFARTPYAVSFRSGGKTFILVTLHVLYGDSASERTPELKAIAEWLASWAKEINEWGHNLIALGDFNIDRQGDPRYQAFTSTGLRIPGALENVPRTLFSDPENPDQEKFYDQIAWFTGKQGKPALSMDVRSGGFFNFRDVVLSDRGLSDFQLSWRVSDHYPLWVSFSVDG